MKKKAEIKKSQAKQGVQSSYAQWYYLGLGLLVIITALVYGNSLRNPILPFDDNEYFSDYPEILALSWGSVKAYFSNYYVLMYQPLPILSFAIQYHFSQLNTYPMHIFNLVFHLVNIVLVFKLVHVWLEKYNAALIVALLFALHPLNVEAVSWLSARSSVMYTCFYLSSLIFYSLYLRKDRKIVYLLLAFLLFLISLFSKAQAVTLPVVLLLIDYFYGYWKDKKLWLIKVPFFVCSVIFGIVAIMDKGTMGNITTGMLVSYSYFDMFFLLSYSFVFYIYKFFLPFSLSAIYVYPPKTDGMLPWEYYLAPLVLAAFIYLVYRLSRYQRAYLFGFLLFLVTISLNVQIIPSRLFIATDRYAYFPFIGFYVVVAYALFKDTWFAAPARLTLKGGIIVVTLLYTVAFGYTVNQRNLDWKDTVSFMTDIIKKNPEVPYLSRAYGNRGIALLDQNFFEEAASDFTNAIRLNPTDEKSWINRAVVSTKLNQPEKAILDLDTALKVNPKNAFGYSQRGIALNNLGQYDKALADCNKAIALKDDFGYPYNTRGAILFAKKDLNGALKDFTRAIELMPRNTESLRNRGVVLYQLKRKDEACADWSKAAELGDQEAAKYLKDNCL
jgi:Flp pilus assembly protein TadD